MKKGYKAALMEMEWAVGQALMANSDRNPNREAQLNKSLRYAHEVAIAARSGEPLPKRPDVKRAI